MFYIQMKSAAGLETVDEFMSLREARAMLAEYRTASLSCRYYISRRACKAWTKA